MTPLGKFLRIKSGLREGQRIDYPPLSPWAEREGRRKARERRESLRDYAQLFAIMTVALVVCLWVALDIVDRMLP